MEQRPHRAEAPAEREAEPGGAAQQVRERGRGLDVLFAGPALLAGFVATVGNGIAVQAAGGAGPDTLHRVVDAALRAWPPA